MPRTITDPAAERAQQAWTPLRRVAFRFAAIYLGLFCLATQISGSLVPNLWFTYRGLGRLSPMRDVTEWVGRTIFGVTAPLDFASNGEPLYFWIQTAWILVVALTAAAAWSLLDRRPRRYDGAFAWMHLAVRIALAASLLEYGMTKVIPTQFPEPPLTALVTPVGDLTLSALLWTTIGAAPWYQIFTGCIETLAGVLLLLPRTTTLGAALGSLALAQILALNMTYDIGLKLITLHLLAMALFVLGPDLPALSGFFWGRRAAAASPAPPVLPSARGRRAISAAQVALVVYLLGTLAYINWSFWQTGGGGRPRSALYGIWNVERLAIDGEVKDPATVDYDRRWRRVIFDEPDRAVIQRTDESFARYGAALDMAGGSLSLTKGGSRNWRAAFAISRVQPDLLELSGEMDGRRIEARLRRVDFDAFPLLNSTFRWIRPHEP